MSESKQADDDGMTDDDLRRPLVSFLPPRQPKGHPVNRIRTRLFNHMASIRRLEREANELLTGEGKTGSTGGATEVELSLNFPPLE